MSPRCEPLTLSASNKVGRLAWNAIWFLLFRPSPVLAHPWRRFLLRIFGARIESTAVVYPSARVWAPWNLRMEAGSCLARYVDCYCVAMVTVGKRAIVSQYSYLCSASHDYSLSSMPLVAGPISIGNDAWLAARAFIGPGVCVGEGAIVGACSAVFRDVEPWTIVGGNPARILKHRIAPSASGQARPG
jgi:putative colanic acid biosynthesis acetyltransferase WcaF